MHKTFILALIPAVVLAGCGLGRRAAPDEFAVARNAPLVIPPDYTLTPPVAGTVTATPQNAQSQAIDALFGGPAPRSQAEMSLLEQAGRDRAALGVRSTAGDPDTAVIDLGAVTQTVLAAQPTNSQVASAQVP
jgi:hypothetical protein